MECLLIDTLPSFFLYQQCEMFTNLHESRQRQTLLSELVGEIVDVYLPKEAGVDKNLYIGNFIKLNQKFFQEDRLIN